MEGLLLRTRAKSKVDRTRGKAKYIFLFIRKKKLCLLNNNEEDITNQQDIFQEIKLFYKNLAI